MVEVAAACLGDGEPLLGGGVVRLAHQLSQLASACLRVRPSRLPGARLAPSLRLTWRAGAGRHWPYQAPRCAITEPVPYGAGGILWVAWESLPPVPGRGRYRAAPAVCLPGL